MDSGPYLWPPSGYPFLYAVPLLISSNIIVWAPKIGLVHHQSFTPTIYPSSQNSLGHPHQHQHQVGHTHTIAPAASVCNRIYPSIRLNNLMFHQAHPHPLLLLLQYTVAEFCTCGVHSVGYTSQPPTHHVPIVKESVDSSIKQHATQPHRARVVAIIIIIMTAQESEREDEEALTC